MRLDIRIQPWDGSVHSWFGKSISSGFLFCGAKRNLAPDFKRLFIHVFFSLLTRADLTKRMGSNYFPRLHRLEAINFYMK